MNGGAKDNISALDAERCTLFTRIEAGGLSDSEADQLIHRHEALDWHIAKTPARDLQELQIKLNRLSALNFPLNEPMPSDCIEYIMIKHIKNDIQWLIKNTHRK